MKEIRIKVSSATMLLEHSYKSLYDLEVVSIGKDTAIALESMSDDEYLYGETYTLIAHSSFIYISALFNIPNKSRRVNRTLTLDNVSKRELSLARYHL